eukprot:CAMPEP_0171396716 /NCGR_PEP_ID=MMETSP0880-20121228/4780_1 /TAXON_ID=67004 /ORGANISM="Thalassiosira weissflogii, Strain CCMP1336" /LENGTH=1178 /DNA_ID=CAMNT_0011910401 /DNA_START=156 /DNA_END=3692 /DNA_ORIENTATION=+
MANTTPSNKASSKAKLSLPAEWQEADDKNFLMARSAMMPCRLPFSPRSRHEPHQHPSQRMTPHPTTQRVDDIDMPAVPVGTASVDTANTSFNPYQAARTSLTPKDPSSKPSMGTRVRSVGFADDLNIGSSTSNLDDGEKGKLHSGNNTENVPPQGILKQSIKDTTHRVRSPSNYAESYATKSHYTLDQVISSQFENEATTHILAALEKGSIDDSMDRLNFISKGWYEQATWTSEEKNESEGDDLSRPKVMSNKTGEGDDVGASSSQEPSDYRYTPSLSPITSSGRLDASRDSFLQRVQMSRDHHDSSDPQSSSVSYPVWQRPKANRTRSTSGVSSKSTTVGEGSCHRDQQKNVHDRDGEGTDEGTAHHDRIKSQASIETNTTANLADRLRSLQKGAAFVNRPSFQNDSNREVGAEALGARPKSSGDKLVDAIVRVKPPKHKKWGRRAKNEYYQLVVPLYPKLRKSLSRTIFLIVLPCLTVASILFYRFENPMAGETKTSLSWWIVFLGVRQMVILELTKIGQIFWIEILALRSSLFQMIVGPYISLIFIMSKGWPYVIFFWAISDFCFLYGDGQFAKHWLFWQSQFDIFNSNNPVDGVTDSTAYLRILCIMIFVGGAVSLKRLTISLFLGRRTVDHFGGELEKIMAKMILIGEVANLAMDIEATNMSPSHSPVNGDEDEKILRFKEFVRNDKSSSSDLNKSNLESWEESFSVSVKGPKKENSLRVSNKSSKLSVGANSDAPSDFVNKKMTATSKNAKLILLLSEWEEPEIKMTKRAKATVQDLLQFRRAVSYMDDKYPFSHAFGPASTREMCVDSSQQVYGRLMESAEDGATAMPFTVFSVLATDESGELQNGRMRSLIRLFRPDRQGNLTKLDFVQSIDAVYKELRLLRASIANSAQIDLAFERVINFFYFFFVGIIAVLIWGINVFPFLLSSTTYFLGLSFLFGAAASNYFEGLLLIFLRRPYDIGDRIALSLPFLDTNPDGSSTWFVEKVSLFTTTVRFATTNEVATYSNGSIAPMRIINANRSPKAIIHILMKFWLETPFQRIKVFRTALENFVNARPREWVALVGFRATRVEADFGYVEYRIICQHREAWQNIGPILQSKADLSSFSLEVSKKLDLRYVSPPMPVKLTAPGFNHSGLISNYSSENETKEPRSAENTLTADDLQDVAALFEIRE